ncbi:MAG: MvaI/BcnI restriction endonuclease family protein [Proteobacteria bacterium]|nr:MvaI/BcnI restriction endonuclease family protein [Pseudomonadota bacterium]
MFDSIASLLKRFSDLGATRVFCKPLAENDNSKQQIYLGASLEVVQMFPLRKIEAAEKGKDSTYKAKLDFSWVGKDFVERATGAQLILYPQYPEVRLSGFLRGCTHAPSEHLRPVPKVFRCFNNGPDGRILFFGITGSGETLAYLAHAESAVAKEFQKNNTKGNYPKESIFFDLPILTRDSKIILLERLAEIRRKGWHHSIRLNKSGEVIPYNARNGGGYTLEALLGIIPNGRSEPDYLGWEIKAYGGNRLTLMTPEPDGGMYGEEGVKAFVRKFGAPSRGDTLYFTGTHRANKRNAGTGLTLVVRGFNPARKMIEDVGGAVELLTDADQCAAAWSFGHLMIGWNKKHAQAAYVRYESEKKEALAYRYLSPALMGRGTDFNRYLSAICAGKIIFDPASKVMNVSTLKPSAKARSQFRMSVRHLGQLYQEFGEEDF